MTILIIDNTRDDVRSYLPMILKLLNQNRIPYIKITEEEEISKINKPINAVLISESPPVVEGNFYYSQDNYELNRKTLEKYTALNVPIVGICFGCQFINTYFGGTLKKLDKEYCRTSLVTFKNEKQIHIQFCLRFIIDKVAPDFKVLAYSSVHGITFPAMIAHKSKHIYGMLFHPEYLEETEFMLHNLFGSFYR